MVETDTSVRIARIAAADLSAYKNLRDEALRLYPDAFDADLDSERARPPESYLGRLGLGHHLSHNPGQCARDFVPRLALVLSQVLDFSSCASNRPTGSRVPDGRQVGGKLRARDDATEVFKQFGKGLLLAGGHQPLPRGENGHRAVTLQASLEGSLHVSSVHQFTVAVGDQ